MDRPAGAAHGRGLPRPHDRDGFTTGFQIVGTGYILGNAAGLLAWWYRPAWLYWLVLAVNLTQGLGWLMIPADMWSVVRDRYGVAGVLPSAVTDGGAVLLALLLLAALVRYRRTWAREPG